MSALSERRLRRIWFNHEFILGLVSGMASGWPRFIEIPTLNGLPKDAEVISVHHDPCDRTFQFIVSSMEFMPVAPGDRIPLLDGFMSTEWVTVPVPPKKDWTKVGIDPLTLLGDAEEQPIIKFGN